MPLSRRTFLRASGGAGLSTVLLSACSSGFVLPEIQMWGKFSNTDTQRYFQSSFVDAYNKSAKTKVTLQAKPSGSFDQTVQTAVAAGYGPDVVVTNSPAQATDYARSGYLARLDSVAAQNNWPSKLLPWALGAGSTNGHLYSVPSSYETMDAYYNPAILHKHNWTAPTDKDEFEAFCAEAKGKGLIPIGAGTASAPDVTQWFVTIFLNSFVGADAVYQALQSTAKWSDPPQAWRTGVAEASKLDLEHGGKVMAAVAMDIHAKDGERACAAESAFQALMDVKDRS